MQQLMWLLMTNTAIACVFALAALTASRLRRPALAHVIWMLVIVKLLTPPLWRVTVNVASRPAAPVAASVPIVSTGTAPRVHAPTPVAISQPVHSMGSAQTPVIIPWTTILLCAWGGGAISYLLFASSRIRKFRRFIVDSTRSDDCVGEVQSLTQRMGMRTPPRVIVTAAAVSPMVLLLGRSPALVLPQALLRTLDAQQRRAVIAHELAHLRRGDHFIRLFEMLATALLWWHPLLWVARLGLRDAEEQCCDAWVVSILPDQRRRFADALVDSMEFVTRCALPATASGLGRMHSLRRRLAMIVDRTPPKSLSITGRLLALALLVALPLAPVRGDEQTAPPASRAATPPVDDGTRRIIEALLETVHDPNQQVQVEAANAILRFGAKAVPVLIGALETEKTSAKAASLLSSLGDDAVDPLLDALQSSNAATRESALRTLHAVFQGKTGSRLTIGGYGGVEGMEGGATLSLAGNAPITIGPAQALAADVPALAARLFDPVVKATQDENVNVRRAATMLLSIVAQARPSNFTPQPILARLKDDDSQVRLMATQALLALCPPDADVVAALANVVGDRDENVQGTALMALAAIGPQAQGATDAVLAALKSANPNTRMMAARALGAMQAKPPPNEPSARPEVGVPGGFGAPQSN